MAERQGFEPWEPKGLTALARPRIRPLCHLSARAERIAMEDGWGQGKAGRKSGALRTCPKAL